MTGELILTLLALAAGAVTLWMQARRREQEERMRGAQADRSDRLIAILGLVFPMIALMLLLQVYTDERKALYLVLMVPAVLAVILGFARVRELPGARPRRPGSRRTPPAP